MNLIRKVPRTHRRLFFWCARTIRKNIADWDDLLREDVGVITPNPKTSGGARWNYLAAWYYFESQGQSGEEITENMKTLYHNVLVLDSGSVARSSTTTFAENFYIPPVGSGCFLPIISVHRGARHHGTAGRRKNGSWMTLHSRILHTFGGWSEASAKHFADGGVFDTIYEQ